MMRLAFTSAPTSLAAELLAESEAQTARLTRLLEQLEAEVAAGRPQVPPVICYLVATRADRLARLRTARAEGGRGAAA